MTQASKECGLNVKNEIVEPLQAPEEMNSEVF
jgi:hypothetical protein